jgi:mannose-6-phosphate isomerase
VDLLEGCIQNYAWGSRSAIAEFLGKPSPSPRPEAELWMGAHPSAPSLIRRDGAWRSLLDVIAEKPNLELGAPVVARFGARLPFLLKVLAADAPLSLQAHPDAAQARAGFLAEEAARIPRDAPQRNYRDASHKPELLAALDRFEALCGFRRAADSLRLLTTLGAPGLLSYAEALARNPDASGLRSFYAALATQPAAARERLVATTLEACAAHRDRGGEFARECAWALRLGALYPGDIGVVLALLLNLVELEPGEAIYLPAGNMHAYLRGTGIEIMASSDNVLRGGLTPKHVDPPELLRVLTFADHPTAVLGLSGNESEQIYETPASEFRLSRIDLGGGSVFAVSERLGAEILLCVAGDLTAKADQGSACELVKGTAIFVPASDGAYVLGGKGTVFRARVGTLA